MPAVDKNVAEGMEDKTKRWCEGDEFVGNSLETTGFLGIQMLPFGFRLREYNTIFNVQHLTVCVDVSVYCPFPVVVIVCLRRL